MAAVDGSPAQRRSLRAAGIVLAAGASRRMGRAKQVLELAGRPLLAHAVGAACASRLDAVVVVIGANADAVRAAVDMGRATTVVNADHARGISASLRAGLDWLGDDVGRAVVLLGDQPDVTPAMIDSLLALHAGSGLPAAAMSFEGLLHPPVVLARQLWAQARALRGDVGLRHLLRERSELVATLAAPRPGPVPVDVDTPEDYARLLRGR